MLCYSARDETEVDLGKRKKAEDLNITCLDPVCFISNLCECFIELLPSCIGEFSKICRYSKYMKTI